jgi:hypothetical protein
MKRFFAYVLVGCVCICSLPFAFAIAVGRAAWVFGTDGFDGLMDYLRS